MAAKPKAVVVRPNFDTATKYGAYYQDYYSINALKKAGYAYTDLYAGDAVKAKFDAAMGDRDVVYLCGTGHGNESLFTGQNTDVLLAKGYESDAKLLNGKSVSLLSCIFGASADWWVERGCKGFFGYNRVYYFIIGVYPNSRAGYFFTSHHAYDVAIIGGAKQGDAFKAAQDAYNKAIKDAPYWDVKSTLIWDRDSMVFKGDSEYAPFRPVELNWWCRFLKWLWDVSGCPGKVCGG
jgi:hypothetical protein